MLDGYFTPDDLVQICRYYFDEQNSDPDLRNRMSHLLGHACLLRGESTRNIVLLDHFSVLLENEGYSECRALVLVMDQGKANQFESASLDHAFDIEAWSCVQLDQSLCICFGDGKSNMIQFSDLG